MAKKSSPDDPGNVAEGARSRDWRKLTSKAEKWGKSNSSMHAQWDTNGFPEFKRGVDIHAQIRRSDLQQVRSRFITAGSHWDVYGNWAEGRSRFTELAKLVGQSTRATGISQEKQSVTGF